MYLQGLEVGHVENFGIYQNHKYQEQTALDSTSETVSDVCTNSVRPEITSYAKMCVSPQKTTGLLCDISDHK